MSVELNRGTVILTELVANSVSVPPTVIIDEVSNYVQELVWQKKLPVPITADKEGTILHAIAERKDALVLLEQIKNALPAEEFDQLVNKTNCRGENFLHILLPQCAKQGKKSLRQLFEILGKEGIKYAAQYDNSDNTAFHEALEVIQEESVQLLLKKMSPVLTREFLLKPDAWDYVALHHVTQNPDNRVINQYIRLLPKSSYLSWHRKSNSSGLSPLEMISELSVDRFGEILNPAPKLYLLEKSSIFWKCITGEIPICIEQRTRLSDQLASAIQLSPDKENIDTSPLKRKRADGNHEPRKVRKLDFDSRPSKKA